MMPTSAQDAIRAHEERVLRETMRWARERQRQALRDKLDRQLALAKLTPREQRLLGVRP